MNAKATETNAAAVATATKVAKDNDVLTLKQIVEETGLSPVYVRRAILTGKLVSTKVRIGDSNVFRHEITRAAFNAWTDSRASRSRRTDGRNKFAIYGKPDEIAELQKLLKTAGLELPLAKPIQAKAKAKVTTTATAAADNKA